MKKENLALLVGWLFGNGLTLYLIYSAAIGGNIAMIILTTITVMISLNSILNRNSNIRKNVKKTSYKFPVWFLVIDILFDISVSIIFMWQGWFVLFSLYILQFWDFFEEE